MVSGTDRNPVHARGVPRPYIHWHPDKRLTDRPTDRTRGGEEGGRGKSFVLSIYNMLFYTMTTIFLNHV